MMRAETQAGARARRALEPRTPARRTMAIARAHCPSAVSLAILAALCGALQAQASLPDAPLPHLQSVAFVSVLEPQTTFPPQAEPRQKVGLPSLQPGYLPLPRPCLANSCTPSRPRSLCCQVNPALFHAWLDQTAVRIYTPRELAVMAARDVADPFNLLTIVGTSAYSVAVDPHSPYGPGMMGWAKFSGVSLTQDMTGEFLGTFLIPSLDHQDPHYHRMPNAPLARRIAHAIYQPFWTVSDTGRGMPNYSTLVGTVAGEALDNAYVPYREVGWSASAQRVAVAWSTDPINNFVTEFFPDVARHINFRIVFFQRIITRVAIEEGGGLGTSPPPP